MSQTSNPFDQQSAIPGVKKVLLVGSGKGGVGKSTVSVNLALSLKELGLNVGVLDADIYGPSLPRLLGKMNQKPEINSEKKLAPIEAYGLQLMSIGFLVDEDAAIVWRGPMLFKAMNQFLFDVAWQDVDVLVVDLPPGTGDVQLSIAQKVKVDGGLIVSTPQNLSLIDARKALDMYEKMNIPLVGWVENMSYLEQNGERIQLFQKGNIQGMVDNEKLSKVAEIPFHPALGTACETGMPLQVQQKDHPANSVFAELAAKVKNQFF